MKSAFVGLFAFLPVIAIASNKPRQEETLKPECVRACSRLANNFGLATHTPGNGNITVWDAKQQEVQSACRVLPTSTEDVSGMLSIVLEESCNFAVKSGGHAQHHDDSVSVGGVTIDLTRMRATEISSNQKTVRLGTGHKLHSVYSDLEKHGLTTLGGRAADVGIGGYTLGGGLSHLSPIYGLAMDNVFEYELVLPNATTVTVNETSQPDLYFALRGGMNNFGVVTHMTMRAVPQHRYYSGARTYTADKSDSIIEQAYKLTTDWKNDTAMSFYYSLGYNQTTDEFDISFTQEYSQPITNPVPFEELNQIPFESDTNRIDWPSKFSEEVNSADPPGDRNHFSTVTYYPSADLDRKIQDIMKEEIQPVKMKPGFTPRVVMQPAYEASIRTQKERGGSASGIDANGPLTVVLLLTKWDNAEDDDAMNAYIDRWIEKATKATKDAGKYHPWRYINYASNRQDPFAGYGEQNVQRLRDIQKSVDPRGVFTSSGLCKGFFKLN